MSSMYTDDNVNSGDLIGQALFDIEPDDHAADVYAKAVRGYEMRGKVLNELETTLTVTLPAETEGAGKKDAKGGKDAKKGKEVPGALVPFREPVAAVLVPRGSMEAVPEVNGTEEAADAKGKKAPAKV